MNTVEWKEVRMAKLSPQDRLPPNGLVLGVS